MNRRELIIAIDRLAKHVLVPGFYVADDDGDALGSDFCREHADIVGRWHARETDKHVWTSSTSMGSDSHRECAFGGCGRHLDFGGLTDYGIDSALGLTETDPLACHVYPSELLLASESMTSDDSRWTMWETHALRLLEGL